MCEQGRSNVVMGTEEDPKDGNAVAGAVFGAVFIYIVCFPLALAKRKIAD